MKWDIIRSAIGSVIPSKPLRIVPEVDVDLIFPTVSRALCVSRVGVRVSAPVRRAAAPYADGCEQIC